MKLWSSKVVDWLYNRRVTRVELWSSKVVDWLYDRRVTRVELWCERLVVVYCAVRIRGGVCEEAELYRVEAETVVPEVLTVLQQVRNFSFKLVYTIFFIFIILTNILLLVLEIL